MINKNIYESENNLMFLVAPINIKKGCGCGANTYNKNGVCIYCGA